MSINGWTTNDLIQTWRPIIPNPNKQYFDYLMGWAVLVHPKSTAVNIKGFHADQRSFDINLEMGEVRPRAAPPAIYSQTLTTEAGVVVGYVRLDTFSSLIYDWVYWVDYTLNEIVDSQVLVLDVRDNGGGSLFFMERLLARFYEDRAELVYFWDRNDRDQPHQILNLKPRRPNLDQPLMLLINGACYSTCNLFAQIIQETSRGRLIGSPTGGGNTSPAWYKMSDSLSFYFPAIYFTPPSGSDGENQGVQPDHEIVPTQQDIARGLYTQFGQPDTDKVLSEALRIIDQTYQCKRRLVN